LNPTVRDEVGVGAVLVGIVGLTLLVFLVIGFGPRCGKSVPGPAKTRELDHGRPAPHPVLAARNLGERLVFSDTVTDDWFSWDPLLRVLRDEDTFRSSVKVDYYTAPPRQLLGSVTLHNTGSRLGAYYTYYVSRSWTVVAKPDTDPGDGAQVWARCYRIGHGSRKTNADTLSGWTDYFSGRLWYTPWKSKSGGLFPAPFDSL
jgi:hypothetical protein